MTLSGKLKQKIGDGGLREMWDETKWMLTYIRRYRFVIMIHILLGIVGTCMSLLSSIGMKRLIDAVTGFRYSNIWGDALYMAGMLVGSAVLSAIAGRIAAIINIRVQNGIQAEIYDRMLRTDWESLEQFRSGDLLQRLNGDVGTVASGVTSFLPSFVTGSVQFFGSLVLILFYDPMMALIALIGAPLSVICSRVLVRRMRDYNKRMKVLSSEVMSFHDDSFRNLTTIKGFGIMDAFFRRMLDLQHRYRTAYLDYNRFSVVASLVMSLVGLLISAGCFGWGVYRLWAHAITYGVMTMFLQLTGMLRGAFSSIIGLVPTYISITTSAGRLMAVVELPEEPGARETLTGLDGDCACEMQDVTFSYADGETVLEHVDMEVRPGELVALTGPSGEGKTTLIRLLLGLVRPFEGPSRSRRGRRATSGLRRDARSVQLCAAGQHDLCRNHCGQPPHGVARGDGRSDHRGAGYRLRMGVRQEASARHRERDRRAGARLFRGTGAAPCRGARRAAQGSDPAAGRGDQRAG